MATVPNLSASAANAQASKNRIPGLCDCSEPSEKSALILYPSLGTPLLLKEGQSKCSIFIVAEQSMRAPAGAGGAMPANAPNLHVFADRHLRVYSIDEKDKQTDTTVGTLFGDGKTCEVAKQHIDAWRVVSFNAGALIKDRHGRAFATVAPMAVKERCKVPKEPSGLLRSHIAAARQYQGGRELRKRHAVHQGRLGVSA